MIDNKKSNRYKKRLLVSSLILVVVAIGQFFLWRLVNSAANDLHNKRTEEEQLQNLRQRLQEISSSLSNQQPVLAGLINVFPDISSSSAAVERLESQADRLGLTMVVQNIQEGNLITSRGPTDIVPLNFQINISGSPEGLLAYLESIEHAPEQVIIKAWTLESSLDRITSASSLTLQRTLSLELTFYLQRQHDAK